MNSIINTYNKLLDNTSNILINIREDIFKELDLGSREQLKEYVKESLEHFSFNRVEKQYFELLHTIFDKAIDDWGVKVQTGEFIDYRLLKKNLIHSLREAQVVEFNIDEDIKSLADGINSNYSSNIGNDWNIRLRGKKKKIISIINKYNYDIVDVLTKLVPIIVDELAFVEMDVKDKNSINKRK